jgi:hypothetical protein
MGRRLDRLTRIVTYPRGVYQVARTYNRSMSITITALHVQGQEPRDVETALEAIFAGEERPRVLRIEGTYSAVLGRACNADLAASYRYVILRPYAPSAWTPVLELGNRTEGLDVELSQALGGCAVFTAFVYGEALSGYRLARGGKLVDRYVSDPTELTDELEGEGVAAGTANEDERVPAQALRGHPERFADLLPAGTAPEDFVRVVLRPGWWEEQTEQSEQTKQADGQGDPQGDDQDDEGPVDEVDRMRCIGLALELWGPSEYPFARDPEEIPNTVAGPAIALAFA